MYQSITMAMKPLSEDLDKTESRIYEPVNTILNFLRLRIDEELSISPVRRLIREYLADQDGNNLNILFWSSSSLTSLSKQTSNMPAR